MPIAGGGESRSRWAWRAPGNPAGYGPVLSPTVAGAVLAGSDENHSAGRVRDAGLRQAERLRLATVQRSVP